MSDCDLARAVRWNELAPSGLTGSQIVARIFRRLHVLERNQPWLFEGEQS